MMCVNRKFYQGCMWSPQRPLDILKNLKLTGKSMKSSLDWKNLRVGLISCLKAKCSGNGSEPVAVGFLSILGDCIVNGEDRCGDPARKIIIVKDKAINFWLHMVTK